MTLFAVIVAALGAVVLPASPAQAEPGPEQFPCPRVYAFCGFTEPGGEGDLVIVWDTTDAIEPPIKSGTNQTGEFWCFFSEPGFGGEMREVAPEETVDDFGWPDGAQSALYDQHCPWSQG
jgi:hypothetical protein